MAEESQVQQSEPATTEQPAATTATEPMTLDAAREKIRANEIKSPEELQALIKQVEGTATTESPESAPTPPKEEKAPVPEPQAKEKAEVQSEKKSLETVDDFLKALQGEGFTYKDPTNAIKGIVNKEQALNRYKEDVYSLQQKLEEKEGSEKQLREEFEKLRADLSKPKEQAPPTPEPKIEIGPMPQPPQYTIDEDEHNKNWAAYQNELTKYYEGLMKVTTGETKKEVARLKKELADQISSHGKSVEQLKAEYAANKRAREIDDQKAEQARVRERAFSAAKDFFNSNKQYALTQPIEKVSEGYDALANEVGYLCRSDPSLNQIAGNDPVGNIIREFAKGNPYVQNVVNNRALPISDDVKTYQFLVDLEADALAHRDYDQHGRPDLEMALIRQKKVGGILAQELQDARVDGFQEAEKVRAAVTNGPATLPADSAAPTTVTEKVTAEQLLQKLQETRALPDNQRKAAMEKLKPLLAQHGFNPQ